MRSLNSFRIVIFILGLLLLLFPAGCEHKSVSLSKLAEGEYLVAFSREFSKPARLVIYKNDGTILEDIKVDNGQALHDSIISKDGFLFTSARINTHYVVDNQGGIKPVSFVEDKYKPNYHTGTYFVDYSQGWVISTMNIGNTIDGYATELVFQEGLEGPQDNISLNLGIIDSAVIQDNVLYAHYMVVETGVFDPASSDYKRYAGIYAYDLKARQELFNTTLSNHSLSVLLGKRIKTYRDYLLIYGDSSTVPFNQQPPCLGVFDINTHEIIREVYFEDDFLPNSLSIYQDNIFILSTAGKMKVLNSNYETISGYQLADNALDTYRNREPYIYKTILQGSELHVIYRFLPQKQNYQMPASIHVYGIETGELKRVVDLRLDNETSWWAEELEVQLISSQ